MPKWLFLYDDQYWESEREREQASSSRPHADTHVTPKTPIYINEHALTQHLIKQVGKNEKSLYFFA